VQLARPHRKRNRNRDAKVRLRVLRFHDLAVDMIVIVPQVIDKR